VGGVSDADPRSALIDRRRNGFISWSETAPTQRRLAGVLDAILIRADGRDSRPVGPNGATKKRDADAGVPLRLFRR
jgi:hypothetical protein